MLTFSCNICGSRQPVTSLFDIDREWFSCFACYSSARTRWIVHALSVALFHRSLLLTKFPIRKDIRGIGLSDSKPFADELAKHLNYTNTFLDREPKLDISKPVPKGARGQYDFVIASEVFEHVAPPIQFAFQNLAHLLRSDGVVIFSVPWRPNGTLEHFPNLYRSRLVQQDGKWVLLNETVSGKSERFDDLRFHEGVGSTLEMRIFGKEDLERHFFEAGFRSVDFVKAHVYLGHGIIFHDEQSLPCSARLTAVQHSRLESFRVAMRRTREQSFESEEHVRLLSGWYELIEGLWRWTASHFSFALWRSDLKKRKLVMRFINPREAHGQILAVTLEDAVLGTMEVGTGAQVFVAQLPEHQSKILAFHCTITPPQPPTPDDDRPLGMVVRFNRPHRVRNQSPFYIE